MGLSQIQGWIDRRLLVNFSADPEVVKKLLPSPFRPQLQNGRAIVGVCLIRFSQLRPRFIPGVLGLRSENAAHRVAVEWDTPRGTSRGVYIFRRDTSSYLKTILGGRVFSGIHHRADFVSEDHPPHCGVQFKSRDGELFARVKGSLSDQLPKTSCFSTLEESSRFFQLGSVGFSPSRQTGSYQGMKLITDHWETQAFSVEEAESSFFKNHALFPQSSIVYDHSLIMRAIPHHWDAVETIRGS